MSSKSVSLAEKGYQKKLSNTTHVYPTKEIVQDLKRVVRLRKKILIITLIFFVLLSFGALHIIEPKYESSISILVQKEEALNPIMFYEIAANIASEDRLKSFNEIIYSRSTMEMLVDSLNLYENIEAEAQKQDFVDDLRKNIVTSSRSSDSFEITDNDTDPVRARDGVALLADHFIETRLKLENRRNNETVELFQTKLDELEQMVDKQRNQIVNETTEQSKVQPVDQSALQNRLQSIDTQLDELDWRIIQDEEKLEIFKDFLGQDIQDLSVQPLYKLSLNDLPFGEELGTLLGEYDQLRQQYTDNYPRLRTVRNQIVEVAKRIPPSINTSLNNLKLKRKELNNQRSKVINDMEKAFVAAQQNSKQSNHTIYQQLYNDMKVKLEQVRTTRDVGSKASDKFVVLDPPYIPKEPSSPDRQLVVTMGFVLGIVIGTLLMAVSEVLDTTIRTEENLELDKPIIAYLTDGRK
jgi:uncharacterized protein involved in exopolysaccharide biosynthesis